MIFTELLDGFSPRGAVSRRAAILLVETFAESQNNFLIPQSPELFAQALDLYKSREDKRWSLTDCASMVIMDQMNIEEALAYDHHFVQAGFKALLRE